MAKRKSKKQLRKEKEQRKKVIASSIRIMVLLLLIGFSGYFLVNKFVLSNNINKETASFISFRNTLDGSQLIFDEVKVLSDKEGKSYKNKSVLKFDIDNDGVDGSSFDIVITPINNKVDLKYVKYYLVDSNNKEVGFGNLYIAEEANGGRIIHSGKKKKKSDHYKLKLWISDEYKGKDTIGNTYEVKIYLK